MPQQIHLTHEELDENVDKLAGQLLGPESYDLLITEDADVYKPNGEVLIKYRKGIIPKELCVSAFPALESAASKNDGRGTAAGMIENPTQVHQQVGKQMKNSFHSLKADGTVSHQVRGKVVRSGVIGYFDRSGRFPYCRMTSFNVNEPGKFAHAMPFIQAVDKVFAENMPERYATQMEYVQSTADDFKISETAFTTITVNMNFRTACHKDVGDLKEGFGVLACMRAGHFEGGYLCFPKYRVAVDMRTQDVVLADVHEWHANTPIKGKAGQYKRMTCVFYYREGMRECGTAEEELERVQRLDRKGITK